jgi:hypothetical protein
MTTLRLFPWLLAMVGSVAAQVPSLAPDDLEANDVAVARAEVQGHAATRVEKSARVTGVDEPTFAKVRGVRFQNGVIEVKVLSRLLPNAPAFARGFIGVAFRIADGNSRFEAIYVRPTNGRAPDQLRRNRSVQYFAYPDFKFQRLRDEAPGVYESYADMGLDEWITLRIEVRGAQAKLFLNGQPQPTLIVNDLKLGPAATGGIGLWVDVGTEGFFRDLVIRPE